MGVKRIVVNIDRVSLRGIGGDDSVAFVEGLRQELSRVLIEQAAQALPLARLDVPLLRIRPVSVSRSAQPRQVGVRVAQGIAKGLL
jgi:hypothetical protein